MCPRVALSVWQKKIPCWVTKHVGVAENERVDPLAREAAARAVVPCPVPHSDVFSAIGLAVLARWQERWDAHGVTSKRVNLPGMYPTPGDRRYKIALYLLRIGHTRFTHGYLISGNC